MTPWGPAFPQVHLSDWSVSSLRSTCGSLDSLIYSYVYHLWFCSPIHASFWIVCFSFRIHTWVPSTFDSIFSIWVIISIFSYPFVPTPQGQPVTLWPHWIGGHGPELVIFSVLFLIHAPPLHWSLWEPPPLRYGTAAFLIILNGFITFEPQ